MKAQLKELVTKYDPAVLWFDGEWVDWWTEEDGQVCTTTSAPEADIIINNRVGKGAEGHGRSQQDRPDVRRRLRHARAADPRHRPSGRRLGKLHDDERHVGVQVVRRQLEGPKTLMQT